MKPYNICTIVPAGYAHYRAFDELVELIFHGLTELGIVVTTSTNSCAAGARNIVLGCHLLELERSMSLPPDSIIFNTEQLGAISAQWQQRLVERSRQLETWDYSLRNVAHLKTLGVEEVRYFRVGHHPKLARIIKPASQPIDVLFYGSVTERRQRVLEDLGATGLNVKSVFGVYGKERDELIAQAKVVLNCHAYESKIHEIVRSFYLMTNRKAVVAELDGDTAIDPAHVQGIHAAAYGELVEACCRLVAEDRLRAEVEARAHACIAAIPQAEVLRELLELDRPNPASSPPQRVVVPGTIGLCMIVKNEAHVIRRCLDSAKPIVDFVLVEDTGSSDGTQEVIRSWLQENRIRGIVTDVPWRDFAFNRSHALQALRKYREIDYALVIDADDTLVFAPDFDRQGFKQGLRADLLDIEIEYGGIRYHRPQMMRNALDFSYRGVLHEFVEPPPACSGRETLEGVRMRIGGGGGRSQETGKFERDARLLEEALSTETDPFLRSRYTFYLAQSLFDSGQHQRALEAYLARSRLGYWQEEVFISLYRAAKLQERLAYPHEEVVASYLRATAAQPARAEALHAAARFCRLRDDFERAYWFARRGLSPKPCKGLFVEDWIYDYGLLDELAVSAYWSGRFSECESACEQLLREGLMPASMRARVEDNLAFARAKAG